MIYISLSFNIQYTKPLQVQFTKPLKTHFKRIVKFELRTFFENSYLLESRIESFDLHQRNFFTS